MHKIELLNTQVESQMHTMQFIGREIHDSVAQKLTLASIYIQRMEYQMQSTDEKDKLSGVSKILNDSLLELKQLSRSLTDNKLQDSTLEELVSLECAQVNATNVCMATYSITTLPVLSVTIKSSLLRIVQEFIQNSVKHSGCEEIKININAENNKLAMLLEDDGKGFDIENMEHAGIGLDSIKRRVQSLGGEYNFHSNIGKGMRLSLCIPGVSNN